MTDYVLFRCGHVQLNRDAKEDEVLAIPEIRRDTDCPRCEIERGAAVARAMRPFEDFVAQARKFGAV